MKRNNKGKPPLTYILQFNKAVSETAKVFEMGNSKYGSENLTKELEDIKQPLDSCLRHISKYLTGEKLDKESGFNHLAHAISNLLIALEKER